jgi:excisionase family DNA binding protein
MLEKHHAKGFLSLSKNVRLLDLNTNRECTTTPQAAEHAGLSLTHLSRLLRSGTLEGIQLGREWLVYTDSLDRYLTTPRKPGPRGPIKKSKLGTGASKENNSEPVA